MNGTGAARTRLGASKALFLLLVLAAGPAAALECGEVVTGAATVSASNQGVLIESDQPSMAPAALAAHRRRMRKSAGS